MKEKNRQEGGDTSGGPPSGLIIDGIGFTIGEKTGTPGADPVRQDVPPLRKSNGLYVIYFYQKQFQLKIQKKRISLAGFLAFEAKSPFKKR